jgi:hypothetical protein
MGVRFVILDTLGFSTGLARVYSTARIFPNMRYAKTQDEILGRCVGLKIRRDNLSDLLIKRKDYTMNMIIDKLQTELIRLNSELSDSLDRYKEQDQLTDDELIAQGWFEATEHFTKILEQYTQEESEEHNEHN